MQYYLHMCENLRDANIMYIPLEYLVLQKYNDQKPLNKIKMFIGQININYTRTDLIYIFAYILGHMNFTIGLPRYNNTNEYAFIYINDDDIIKLLNFNKYIYCDNDGIWIANTENEQNVLLKIIKYYGRYMINKPKNLLIMEYSNNINGMDDMDEKMDNYTVWTHNPYNFIYTITHTK